ncbi:MAG: hypothetical protein R2865_06845 [Deinococcales bacterium]
MRADARARASSSYKWSINWKEHLHNMDVLRQRVFSCVVMVSTLQEYAFEGFNLFNEMKDNIRSEVSKLLFRVQVQVNDPNDLKRNARNRQSERYSSNEDVLASSASAQAQASRLGRQGPPALNRDQRRRQERLAKKGR